MVWPFSRRREEPAAQAPPPAPARPTREWAALPALEPVGLRAAATITDVTSFEAGLTTRWAPPPVLEPLGHEVSLEAPAGLVSNILAPVEGYRNAPELTWAEPAEAELPELPVVGVETLVSARPLPVAEPLAAVPPAPTSLPDAVLPDASPEPAPTAAEVPAAELPQLPEPERVEAQRAAEAPVAEEPPAQSNPVRRLGRIGPPLSIDSTPPAVLPALGEPPAESAFGAAPMDDEPDDADEPEIDLPGAAAGLSFTAEAALPEVVMPSSFSALLPDLGRDSSPAAEPPQDQEPSSLLSSLGLPSFESSSEASVGASFEASADVQTRPLLSARPPLLDVAADAMALLPGLVPAQEPAEVSAAGPARQPAEDPGFAPVPDLLAGFTMPDQSVSGSFSASASLPDVAPIVSGFSSAFDTSAFTAYPPPAGRTAASSGGEAEASGGGGFDIGGLASGGFDLGGAASADAGAGGFASGGFGLGGFASGGMSAGGFDVGGAVSGALGGSPFGGLFGSQPAGEEPADEPAGGAAEDSGPSGFPLGDAPVALPPWVTEAMTQAGSGPLVFGASDPGPSGSDDDDDDAAPSGTGPDTGSWSFAERPAPAAPQVRRRMGRIGMPQESETAEPERAAEEPPAEQLDDEVGSMFGQLGASLSAGASASMPFMNPAAGFFGALGDGPAAPDAAPAPEADADLDDEDDDEDDEHDDDDHSGEHMEILAGQLYDKLRDRLRRELLVDRERSLTLTDWR